MWDRAQSCGVQVRRIPISDETLTQKQKKKGKKQTQHQTTLINDCRLILHTEMDKFRKKLGASLFFFGRVERKGPKIDCASQGPDQTLAPVGF